MKRKLLIAARGMCSYGAVYVTIMQTRDLDPDKYGWAGLVVVPVLAILLFETIFSAMSLIDKDFEEDLRF